MYMPSVPELLIVFLFVLLLFGAKRIPEIARALGKASREFKKAKDEIVNDTEEIIAASEKKAEKEEKAESQVDEEKKS